MKLEDFKSNITKVIDDYVLDQRRAQPLMQSRFRASGITDCPRAILFSMMNLPQDKYPRATNDSARGYKLMRKGTALHEVIQEYLQGIGILKKEDTEKDIKDDEYLFTGHCDGVLTFDEKHVLLEIKTIQPGDRGFDSITQPKEAHYYQGQVYTHFLNKQFGYKIDDILFLYVDRGSDNIDLKPFWVKKDQKIIDMILNKLKVLKQYFEREELYPIPDGFKPDDHSFTPCRWCPFNTLGLCKSGKLKMSEFPGAKIIKK
jgi:hypothetical protein